MLDCNVKIFRRVSIRVNITKFFVNNVTAIDPYWSLHFIWGKSIWKRIHICKHCRVDYTCHFGGKRVFLIEHIINHYLVMRVNIISPKFFWILFCRALFRGIRLMKFTKQPPSLTMIYLIIIGCYTCGRPVIQ